MRRSDLSSEQGRGGAVVVKCVARIYDIYYKIVEHKIQRRFKNKKRNQNKTKYNQYILDNGNNFQGKS